MFMSTQVAALERHTQGSERLLRDEEVAVLKDGLCPGQRVAYRIGNLSNAEISDFFVYRRVYRIEPPISSISICPRYAFILSFSAENSPKNPKILWKFRKFSENSENSQKFLKIRRKF